MKVLLVNTFDQGGAANSCKRLHLGLLKRGIDSKVLLRSKQNQWPESFEFKSVKNPLPNSEKVRNKLNRILKEFNLYKEKPLWSPQEQDFIKRRIKGLEMFSFPKSTIDITQSKLYKEADIINLHWVANFLDLESFFEKNTKPVVWTLHDMNPFSGGEHYEEKILGNDKGGLPLPRQLLQEDIEFMNRIEDFKKKIFEKENHLSFIAPSEWLAQQAVKSRTISRKKVYTIPNGVDIETFSPKDMKYSREVFNIPQDKMVVLFVADSLKTQRKGFTYLQMALEYLNNEKVVLCALGKNQFYEGSKRKDIIFLGDIKDELLMSIAYSAADVFVIPSTIDNLPNTVSESMLCGTPVVGFPVGGIPEMIMHGINGLLTEKVDASSLAKTLYEFIENKEKFDREVIRKIAVKKYYIEEQVQKYLDLFEEKLQIGN